MPAYRPAERLTPLAASLGLQGWIGDLHNHCAISYGHGSLDEALANAKRQLDFVSITGHSWWPDMPVDEPSVAHIVAFHVEGFARLERLWPGHFAQLQAAAEPGAFTVFPGYEMHSSAHGDYTVLLRDLAAAPMVRGTTPAKLEANLRAAFGRAAMAFPHHIGYRTGARGINWDTFRESLSPVLEMLSMHGCSESSSVDRPFLHSMGPSDGVNTVFHGLNAGHRFGVLGNTDHHSGFPGSYGHGRSVLWAAENSPQALWQALEQRRSGALTGDNIHLLMSVAGAIPGGEVAPGQPGPLKLEAVAGGAIDYIDVILNGRVLQRITPEITPSPIDQNVLFETILVLELGWGARGRHHDWQGRIALKGGQILGLEPRLRGAEIVSPLEGDHEAAPRDEIALDGDAARFRIRAHANPNNQTPSQQAIALHVALAPEAEISLDFGGGALRVPAQRLRAAALSGNLGVIDTPAWRLGQLAAPSEWQWQGEVALPALKNGDWLMARLRQKGGQMAWTSPIFCGPRAESPAPGTRF